MPRVEQSLSDTPKSPPANVVLLISPSLLPYAHLSKNLAQTCTSHWAIPSTWHLGERKNKQAQLADKRQQRHPTASQEAGIPSVLTQGSERVHVCICQCVDRVGWSSRASWDGSFTRSETTTNLMLAFYKTLKKSDLALQLQACLPSLQPEQWWPTEAANCWTDHTQNAGSTRLARKKKKNSVVSTFIIIRPRAVTRCCSAPNPRSLAITLARFSEQWASN